MNFSIPDRPKPDSGDQPTDFSSSVKVDAGAPQEIVLDGFGAGFISYARHLTCRL